MKIALYLQTKEAKIKNAFDKAMRIVKESTADILVFPEDCYTPFTNKFKSYDLFNEKHKQKIIVKCSALSKRIGKSVIVSSQDSNGVIFSLYANAFAKRGETHHAVYVKHTMTGRSAMEEEHNYCETYKTYFQPIILKKHRIGMTICHDCTQSLFSRMFGLNGVDILINSTGHEVVYAKWHRYNQARAIENNCYVFVTMGREEINKNCSCVLGFSPQGQDLKPQFLYQDGKQGNKPGSMLGGIYIYDIQSKGIYTECKTVKKTVNEHSQFKIPVQDSMSILKKTQKISNKIHILKLKNMNIVMCLVRGNDIMKPEKVLPFLYAKELKEFNNKRYIIINSHQKIDNDFYQQQLSAILRVRAMENFCAVLVTSKNIIDCYQSGKCKTSQILAPSRGFYKIDLNRAGGPESIWANQWGTNKRWRKNVEYLINELSTQSHNNAY